MRRVFALEKGERFITQQPAIEYNFILLMPRGKRPLDLKSTSARADEYLFPRQAEILALKGLLSRADLPPEGPKRRPRNLEGRTIHTYVWSDCEGKSVKQFS